MEKIRHVMLQAEAGFARNWIKVKAHLHQSEAEGRSEEYLSRKKELAREAAIQDRVGFLSKTINGHSILTVSSVSSFCYKIL